MIEQKCKKENFHRVRFHGLPALSLIVIVSILLSGCSRSNLISKQEYEYARVGNFSLKGDFYRPKNEEKMPAVILVHGGSFVVGSRTWKRYVSFSRTLARNGYAVFNIDYRLSSEGGTYPNNVRDVNCSVRWLKANSEKLNIDRDRMGIIGFSAGGYLALMAAYTQGDPYELPECPATETDSRVKAVAAYYSLNDLEKFDYGKEKQILMILFGDAYGVNEKLYDEASPINLTANAPPTLLVHGSEDKGVPLSQSTSLYEVLKNEGVPTELVVIDGADHGFIQKPKGKHTRKAVKETLDFIELYLRK